MIEIWAMTPMGMEWLVAKAHNEFVADIIVKALKESDPTLTFTIEK